MIFPKIYLVRHGNTFFDPVRSERVLSDLGQMQASNMAKFLKEKKIEVSFIYHSEKLRAKQTAEILSLGVSAHDGVVARLGLKPNDDIENWVLECQASKSNIMIVGHMPFMPLLLSKLVLGHDEREIVLFSEVMVVCLSKNPHNDRFIVEWCWGS